MLVCVKDAGLRPRRFAAPAGSLTQPVRDGLAEVSGRGTSFCLATCRWQVEQGMDVVGCLPWGVGRELK
jgi:hypothetical protein